jgi:CMP/dCMP kinase
MIISLGGLAGAGKSTVKKLLAETLGWKSYGMGDLRGKYALEHGMTIDELNAQGMHNPASDQLVDVFQKELGEKEDNFVIDGWMSWHFIPHSFKVFLTIDPLEGAQRIFAEQQLGGHSRQDERPYTSVEDAAHVIAERITQNQKRLQQWYGVDFMDTAHYDLIIDTTFLTPQEVLGQILAHIPTKA